MRSDPNTKNGFVGKKYGVQCTVRVKVLVSRSHRSRKELPSTSTVFRRIIVLRLVSCLIAGVAKQQATSEAKQVTLSPLYKQERSESQTCELARESCSSLMQLYFFSS
jgi:hypothetical protein